MFATYRSKTFNENSFKINYDLGSIGCATYKSISTSVCTKLVEINLILKAGCSGF